MKPPIVVPMLMGLLLAVAGEAEAHEVSFDVIAEDPDGRTISARFGYDTSIPFAWASGASEDEIGAAEFYGTRLMGAVVRFEGQTYDFWDHPEQTGFEIHLSNGTPGGWRSGDGFNLDFPEWRGDYTVGFDLGDAEGTAFTTWQRLPSHLDLDQFEYRPFRFDAAAVTFRGTITSLVMVPEPPTLALVGPAALLGLAGWRWRRRKAA